MVSESDTQVERSRWAGLFGLLKALGLVVALVFVQVVAAAVLIPSASDTASTARQLVAAEQGQVDATPGSRGGGEARTRLEKETCEVELGRFNVTRYNPETDKTLVVDFDLFGVVLADQQSDFYRLFESKNVRIREQVIMTLHGAETTDLSDSELGLIKRRILEKTNRALGTPMLHEVLFSKFNFVER